MALQKHFGRAGWARLRNSGVPLPHASQSRGRARIYDGKALGFKFKKLYPKKWKELKATRKGRLLPPALTRLQERYAGYLQRPGLTRVPVAAFPHPPAKTRETGVKTEATPAAAANGTKATIVETTIPLKVADDPPGEGKA